MTTTPRALALAVAFTLLLAGAPALTPGASAARPAAQRVGELVVNGDFEDGTAGWKTNRRRQQLVHAKRSLTGRAAARVSASAGGRAVLKTVEPPVAAAPVQQTYRLTAYVRSIGRAVPGRLRVRELDGRTIVARHWVKFTASRSGWTRLRLTFTTQTPRAALEVNVLGTRLRDGRSLLVDDVSMITLAPPVAWPAGEGPCVSDPMGIPNSGSTYLGAAVSGGTDTESREAELGQRLALHRTFYKADQIDRAVRNATADLAAGRLPWISFKAPHSWEQMASGAGDDWSRELADALAKVPGPVWLAVHHEPENDGNMDAWTQMQRKVAPIIHARTDNVAYSVIYSGWNTFGGDNNTVASKWPGDQHIDILAVDAYNDFGAVRGGREGKKVLDLSTYYAKMAAWATAHGTAWAIGETGQTRKAAAQDPTWLDRTYQAMVDMGGAGLSYYDSTHNSVADWTLDDPIKFARFQGLQAHSARLC